jgi:hypothetical protein
MDEVGELLDALWAAAVDGDTEAAVFLQMFAPWVLEFRWGRANDSPFRGINESFY